MFLKSLAALVRAHITEILRSKTAIFWMLAFPFGFLMLFGYVMARGDAKMTAFLLPGLLTTTLMSGGIFGLAIPLVMHRETGLLRRLRVTPVSATAVALAHGVTAVITGYLTLILLIIVAKLVFGATMVGSWFSLTIVFLCGATALIPLGLLVGSTARDLRTAPAIGNLLFFPMMFLSGSAMPLAMMPDAVKKVARILPTTYLVEAYSGVIVRGESAIQLASILVALVGFGAVAMWLTSMLFRWEGSDPISRAALAKILVSFASVLLLSAVLAPAFRINEFPSSRQIQPGDAKGKTTILRGATVLDGLGGRIENARVVIRDHKIAEIVVEDPKNPYRSEGGSVTALDLTGKFLIPGLIDSHVHWGGSGGFGETPEERTGDRLLHDFGATLSAGVTSVVSLTDSLDDMKSLAEAVAKGEERAPRTFFSGPSITAKGGHPAEMFSFMPGLAEQLTRQVSTEAEAVRAIEELEQAGVDLVKLVLEPGFKGRELPRLEENVFRAAMQEAKKRKMRTTVHVGTDDDVRLAIDAGADGIEHVARGLSRETIAMMAAKRVTFTPTNVVLDIAWKVDAVKGQDALVSRLTLPSLVSHLADPESIFTKQFATGPLRQTYEQALLGALEETTLASKAGVPILAGSDAGNPATFHGVSLIRELELLARAQVPLTEVLKAATSRAADRLGQRSLGRIATGSVADLVVLDKDPMEDVTAYRSIVSVFLGGRKLDLDTILTSSPGPWRQGR